MTKTHLLVIIAVLMINQDGFRFHFTEPAAPPVGAATQWILIVTTVCVKQNLYAWIYHNSNKKHFVSIKLAAATASKAEELPRHRGSVLKRQLPHNSPTSPALRNKYFTAY